MSKEGLCSLHRKPAGRFRTPGVSFCRFDSSQVNCGGRMRFCEKSEILRKHLLDREWVSLKDMRQLKARDFSH